MIEKEVKYPEINYTVIIREVETGREVTYHDKMIPWEDDEGYGAVSFMWGMGNYSCDCNRQLFFCDAAGLPRLDEDEYTCGNKKYFVKAALDKSGIVVLDELKDTA